MNTLLKMIADSLLAGDIARARSLTERFPPYYRSRVIDENGKLWKAGLEDAIDYPLNQKLKALLKSALSNGKMQLQDYDEFQRQIEIFQLADEDARLTDYGQMKAVECLSLTEQCEYLSISLHRMKLEKTNEQVETDVLEYYQNLGWNGLACEGYSFFALFKSLTLPLLLGLQERRGIHLPNSVLEADVVDPNNPDEVQDDTKWAILDAIQNSDTSDIVRNFSQFYEKSIYSDKCPGLTPALLASLYSSLTLEQLVGLAEFFLEKPYAHRSGWPDVTLTKGGSTKLVEVKTNDKLRCAQIRALPRIRTYIPDISVLQVQRIA